LANSLLTASPRGAPPAGSWPEHPVVSGYN